MSFGYYDKVEFQRHVVEDFAPCFLNGWNFGGFDFVELRIANPVTVEEDSGWGPDWIFGLPGLKPFFDHCLHFADTLISVSWHAQNVEYLVISSGWLPLEVISATS